MKTTLARRTAALIACAGLGLAAPAFAHHYMVNATPSVRDVDFARAGVDPTTILPATKDWRTLLVGGMGKGGRGYFALDITNPTTFASEAAMAANVLWEFTDEDMGYSYGLPRIAKTAASVAVR